MVVEFASVRVACRRPCAVLSVWCCACVGQNFVLAKRWSPEDGVRIGLLGKQRWWFRARVCSSFLDAGGLA